MPPLDDEQLGQVTELIRAGLQRGFEVRTEQVTAVQNQLASSGNELEKRLGEFTTKMEGQVSTLRAELEVEFAKTTAKLTEINEKLNLFDRAFEDKKTALELDISASFAEFGSKCTEMKTLIDQSGTVLQRNQQIVDGAILSMNARVDALQNGVQITFQEMRAKNAGYDAIIEARGAGGKGGKGGSGSGPYERTGYADGHGHGLLHEKDIRMPLLPEHFDKVETFRRWWKDVAEFCERRQDYTDCSACSRPSGATRTHWRPKVRWRRC